MNVKELIKEFEEIGIYGLNMFGAVVKGIPTETAIDLIKQLDEPEKVKVPQFVADWYENNKDYLEYNFQDWLKHLSEYRFSKNEQFGKWVNNPENNPAETLIKMKLFGYTVKEEKRYTVVMKETKQPLYYNAGEKKLFFSLGGLATIFTQKQLEEAGFGWVFDCEGIEIEEVE